MTEHNHQVALFNWAQLAETQYPELDELWAYPIGGFRHKATASKMKAEGAKAGYPDIGLDIPRMLTGHFVPEFNGLRIELKVGANRPTLDQWEWIDKLRNRGFDAVALTGWEAARDYILWYLRYSEEKPEQIKRRSEKG